MARAEKQVAEAVLDEILPDGPKKFPDDFSRQRRRLAPGRR